VKTLYTNHYGFFNPIFKKFVKNECFIPQNSVKRFFLTKTVG